RACRSSSGPLEAPTSSCPAFPPCATWPNCAGQTAVRPRDGRSRAQRSTDMTDIVSTPATLVSETRSELARLFSSGRVGDIPDGPGRGTLLLGAGATASRLAAAACYALWWRGKVVNARRRRLKNILTPLNIQAIAAAVYKQESWVDGALCIVLD